MVQRLHGQSRTSRGMFAEVAFCLVLAQANRRRPHRQLAACEHYTVTQTGTSPHALSQMQPLRRPPRTERTSSIQR